MLILAIVLGLFFLAVLFPSIPVDLAFSYERGESSRSRMRIGWLFGLIGKEAGGKTKASEKKPKQTRAKWGGWASEGLWVCSGPEASREGSFSSPGVFSDRCKCDIWTSSSRWDRRSRSDGVCSLA